MKKLTIYLNKRLPDLKKIPEEYDNYGRFGIDNKDNYFFSFAASSHPRNTKEGFYWAIKNDYLYISPRGCTLNWENYINKNIIVFLMEKFRLQYKNVEIIK